MLEAVLFVSDSPVPLEDLHAVLEAFNRDEIRLMVDELNQKFEGHGLQVVEIAEGYQMRTRPECGEYIKKFHKLNRSTKLSQAALETLSIIAYRQPITRQEVEDIRGVDCGGVLKNLLDKSLVKSLGRKKVPGKPVTFGTTKKFLEYFGLVKLSDLPTLKDLPGDEAAVLQEALNFGDKQELESTDDMEPPQESDTDDIMKPPGDEGEETGEEMEEPVHAGDDGEDEDGEDTASEDPR
ncbi:MAG: SMC-Scp complex subunit ScpB [Nitrospinae bacterium]|nr:SMC-Scp complex subunit ScpB [Nitrospinota bacterium]